ncbi:MAG: NifU family protein [Candidatus Magnetobacterium sp. LHC-1]|uniref:NifU family protein n=1 Tax=Candidatus Magnetobacterium casense TaxID=1455061 RepID=A0ABS6S3F8_9BACT|nr:NifU family protein [Candidatus Magnetobacterium casensis]MBF0607936.1 NifU family protein [Nitrospirota bacterium]MBV6342893.1 NifU family protein [Candidatus Magnetobacterium casensis]
MVDRTEVESALNQIRPALRRDGGDVELVDITDDGIVKVKLIGACGSCPMSIMTLKGGIEVKLKSDIPGIKAVEAV